MDTRGHPWLPAGQLQSLLSAFVLFYGGPLTMTPPGLQPCHL